MELRPLFAGDISCFAAGFLRHFSDSHGLTSLTALRPLPRIKQGQSADFLA